MVYSKVSELPEVLQSALSSLGYGKNDIELQASETVSQFIGGGDGYRGFVAIVDLLTGQKEIKYGSWGGSNAFVVNAVDSDTASYKIPPNVAVIKGSEGGSRPVLATIHLATENMVKYLPAKNELNDRDKWILYTFKGFTSAGRKNEWDRNRDIPTQKDIDSLVSRGYIKQNKGGACSITTEGKNVMSSIGLRPVYHPKDPYFKKD